MARIRIERNITKDTNSNKYHVTLYYGRDGEKAKRKNKTVGSLKEARALLKKHECEILNMQTSYSFATTTLLKCLESFVEKNDLEAATIYTYKNFIKHIKNEKISKKLISELKYSDFEQFKKDIKHSTTLSNKTINKHLAFIKAALNFVEKDEDNIILPVIKKIKMLDIDNKFKGDFYTENECRELIKYLNKSNDFRLKAAASLSLFCGLRRGEICGLKWENVDFERKKIIIKDSKIQIGAVLIDKGTKTEASRREVYMPAIVESILEDYKKVQKNNMDFFGADYDKGNLDYVIVGNLGETVKPNYVSILWSKFLKRNNLRHIRFHDLRHTFVSTGYNSGASLLGMAAAVGHSTTKMTEQVYTHLKKENNVEIGKMISNAILSA
mgnify:FL=1